MPRKTATPASWVPRNLPPPARTPGLGRSASVRASPQRWARRWTCPAWTSLTHSRPGWADAPTRGSVTACASRRARMPAPARSARPPDQLRRLTQGRGRVPQGPRSTTRHGRGHALDARRSVRAGRPMAPAQSRRAVMRPSRSSSISSPCTPGSTSNLPGRPCTTTASLWQNSLSWTRTRSATCFSTGGSFASVRNLYG